jgi:sn-glycerol 3-phosphate transport system ATP-binding protein
MGRAIVREPACFLFDEPLSNLDAKLRVEMRLEIRQLQRRLATTSIYVTHDQMEAMTLADRLVVLNKGRIEQIGTPLEIYRRPQSTFVAAFIGSPAMNLVEAESDGRSVRVGSARFALKGGRVAAGRLLLGLRAEDAILLPKPRKGALDLRVLHIEEVGSHRVVHGDHEGHRLTVTLPSGSATGDRLALSVEADKLHLFASATGQRIG